MHDGYVPVMRLEGYNQIMLDARSQGNLIGCALKNVMGFEGCHVLIELQFSVST